MAAVGRAGYLTLSLYGVGVSAADLVIDSTATPDLGASELDQGSAAGRVAGGVSSAQAVEDSIARGFLPVRIEQTGDYNTANVQQTGSYNQAVILQQGNYLQASIQQSGSHNSAIIVQAAR